jgi:hypothetical protein
MTSESDQLAIHGHRESHTVGSNPYCIDSPPRPYIPVHMISDFLSFSLFTPIVLHESAMSDPTTINNSLRRRISSRILLHIHIMFPIRRHKIPYIPQSLQRQFRSLCQGRRDVDEEFVIWQYDSCCSSTYRHDSLSCLSYFIQL